MGLPTLESVKKAGPVAVIGFIAILVVCHLTGANNDAMAALVAANERIDSMQRTWLSHLDHEVFCPKE